MSKKPKELSTGWQKGYICTRHTELNFNKVNYLEIVNFRHKYILNYHVSVG